MRGEKCLGTYNSGQSYMYYRKIFPASITLAQVLLDKKDFF